MTLISSISPALEQTLERSRNACGRAAASYGEKVRDADQAFAVLRFDRFLPDDADEQERVTVKEIVWTQQEAEREVERLNALNAEKDCVYAWQHTRVKARTVG